MQTFRLFDVYHAKKPRVNAPHEIGHRFGSVHADGALMSYDEEKTTFFEPVTLDKIRCREYP